MGMRGACGQRHTVSPWSTPESASTWGAAATSLLPRTLSGEWSALTGLDPQEDHWPHYLRPIHALSPSALLGKTASCLCASFLVYSQSPVYTVHLRDQNRSSQLTSPTATPRLASPPGSCGHPVLRRDTQDSTFKSHLLQEALSDLTRSFLGSEPPTHPKRPEESTRTCLSLCPVSE